MYRIPLSRGRIAALEVRHFASGVRLIATTASDAVVARIVLTPAERDSLVAALTGTGPATSSVEELVREGAFESAVSWWLRTASDGEDRVQDAIATTWLRAQSRAQRGQRNDRALLIWIFRKTTTRPRQMFALHGTATTRDALSVHRQACSDDVAMTRARHGGPSPEELVVTVDALRKLAPPDQDLLVRRAMGETLADVRDATGRSTATLLRRERYLLRRCHAS
ncbi:MAG: hypothetical protein IV100_30780 [Myxococcales bacterium]|nr:hypothetical protein [Myxococcales bacterium]